MKKIYIYLSILATIFFTGCTNADMNNVLNNISSGIENGLNNVSNLLGKLNTKPSQVFLKEPSSKYFDLDTYKMSIKYADQIGIEMWLSGNVYNKTKSKLVFIVDFLIYDLSGNIVDKGYIKNTADPGIDELHGSYDQYRLDKDLRIVAEQIRTRVYLNGKLIADTHPSSVKSSGTKKSVKPVEKKQVQEPKEENPASPKPRQTRQSIAK